MKENEIKQIEQSYNEYIIKNIPILEEWSGYKYNQIIYDSDKDGKINEIFKNKIINHSHLYFIIIDSNNNVFGHYHNEIIDRIKFPIYNKTIFMFTLNSNGRCEIKKLESKKYLYTFIHDGNCSEKQFYDGNDENNDWYSIFKIEDNYGIIEDIQNNFKDMKSTDITGNDCSKKSGH